MSDGIVLVIQLIADVVILGALIGASIYTGSGVVMAATGAAFLLALIGLT
jgi:hypothetical protein